MSYWGATVITKFLSVVPYIGSRLVFWIWGGFSVDTPTLSRFYTLHFILPFILLFLCFLHLVFLHSSGSGKPLQTNSKGDKVPFKPYFLYKDFLGFLLSFFLLVLFLFYYEKFIECQNFIESKSLVTPEHIQPEWYFLSAYAVLRSIPRKFGGVMMLVLFVLVLFLLPFCFRCGTFHYHNSYLIVIWLWFFNFLFLM
jgi:ubiquinol-cytochrome c reductase cytochrome b subunit